MHYTSQCAGATLRPSANGTRRSRATKPDDADAVTDLRIDRSQWHRTTHGGSEQRRFTSSLKWSKTAAAVGLSRQSLAAVIYTMFGGFGELTKSGESIQPFNGHR